jgi:hypothetical protein
LWIKLKRKRRTSLWIKLKRKRRTSKIKGSNN